MTPDHLNQGEELKAENELLKLKLEMEHGMNNSETSSMSPEIENSWLNYLFNFEQQIKNAPRKKVYDIIGRPAYKKIKELMKEEVSQKLEYLHFVMREKGIQLECICEYDDDLIYQFITEELFEYEMEDMHIDGMVTQFTYEEFYPNHNYDLRRYADEFIESLIQKKWNSKFDESSLSETISYNNKQYNNNEISSIILAFQEGRSFTFGQFNIEHVNYDLEIGEAIAKGNLAYHALTQEGKRLFEGKVIIGFKYNYGYWYISSFALPGFGCNP